MPDLALDRAQEPRSTAVLVLGASGFLGRSVVRALSAAGYAVRGLVRDPLKGSLVMEDGGVPHVGNILDPASIDAAVEGCHAMVHLAANPPEEVDRARVRVEGTRQLVAAAQRAGVRRVIIGSGYWVYAGSTDLIEEDSSVEPHGESQINYEAELAGLAANSPGSLAVMIARPGMVYGDGSWFRGLAESVRAGTYRVVGTGANRWSFVELSDAGTAFRAVLESGRGGQVYNVVDGHPEPLRDFVDLVASELGTPRPGSIRLEDAAREMGDAVARHLAADRPTSNSKLTELGWIPRVPSVRTGIPPLVRSMFPS